MTEEGPKIRFRCDHTMFKTTLSEDVSPQVIGCLVNLFCLPFSLKVGAINLGPFLRMFLNPSVSQSVGPSVIMLCVTKSFLDDVFKNLWVPALNNNILTTYGLKKTPIGI